jgi:hypothetical protein
MYVKKPTFAELWESFRRVFMLMKVEEDPGSKVRRSPVAEGIAASLVWRILCEQRHPASASLIMQVCCFQWLLLL